MTLLVSSIFLACEVPDTDTTISTNLGDERRITYSAPNGTYYYDLDAFDGVDVSTLYEIDETNSKSSNEDLVLLYVQGGPAKTLSSNHGHFYSNLEKDWTFVNVHQSQTLDPNFGKDVEITIAQAKEYTAYSAAILFVVARHFSSQGKKVYIMAHSYGSFITPKMLADYKYEKYVEKVLVLAGRLHMPEEIYSVFNNGNTKGFADSNGDGLFQEVETELFTPDCTFPPSGYTEQQCLNDDKSTRKLQGVLGEHNWITIYTDNNIPLSKVSFATAKLDSAVGFYNSDEQNFVNKGDATLFISESTHGVDSTTDFDYYKSVLEPVTTP